MKIIITAHAKGRMLRRFGRIISSEELFKALKSKETSEALEYARTKSFKRTVVRLYQGFIFAFDCRSKDFAKVLTLYKDEGSETAEMGYFFKSWANGRKRLE